MRSNHTSYDDSNSLAGTSSVNGSLIGSVIGHDDPTAVMGNLMASESSHGLKSVGTIDSFITTENESVHENESRQPQGNRDLVTISEVEHDDNLRERQKKHGSQ